MTRRRTVVLLVIVALTLSGCIAPRTRWVSPSSGSLASPSDKAGLAQWRPCPELAEELLQRKPSNISFDCAKIKVPRDWTTARDGQPSDGKTFDIALLRVRATGQHDRVGSLLVNPGGPGASGVDLAAYLSMGLPRDLLTRFDIVGFDPRGVARSSPVKCFTDSDLDAYFGVDPDPVSQTDFNASAAMSRRMAQSCGTKYGDELRLFSTEQTARDMDAIRAAVGDPKLSYLGYSYGTLLGAVYAELFPKNVRAMVLDGAVDPTMNAVASAESQAKGFERAFDNFGAWCKENATVCPIAPDARAAVVSAMRQARTAPITGAGGRKATAGWILIAVISSLYVKADWLQLGRAIDNLRRGNPAAMFSLADQYAERDPSGHYNNLFDANAAVACTDDDKTPTLSQIRRLQEQWRTKYPLFGPPLALNLICAQWPGKRDPYPTGPAVGAPPIVVVGTTGDPATPYEQTASLAKMLGVGRVLTWQGEGHTAYPQTRCVNDAVNQYLIDLTVPKAGLTCPPR